MASIMPTSRHYTTPDNSPSTTHLFLPASTYSKVQVAIYTWNCNNIIPNREELSDLIGDAINEGVDILVFGIQENYVKPIAHPWSLIEDPISNLIADMLFGEDYIRFHSNYLFGITQFIFCRSSLLPYITTVDSQVMKTGFSGWVGNKGAIITILRLGSVSISCITCHLCSYEENLTRRNEEMNLIFTKCGLPAHSYTFIYGDLNYRLKDVEFETVMESINTNNHLSLLHNDTLTEQIRSNNIPKVLEEASITFKPTYKFVPGTNDYRNAKSRTPAWCDRILHHHTTKSSMPTKLTCTQYGAWPTPVCSDHRVVYAYYDINTDWMAYSPPIEFILSDVTCSNTKDLTVKIIKLPQKDLTVPKSHITLSSWDWVGLHRFGCLHLKDYITYVWSPLKPPEQGNPIHTEKSNSVTFKAGSLPRNTEDCLYQLYYHSSSKGEILAVSSPFSFTDPTNSYSMGDFNL